MRLKNKYNRNRAYRVKHWKRIRNTEHPFETFCPYDRYGNEGYYIKSRFYSNDTQEQINRHFEWINERARYLENGTHKCINASSWFRRQRNSELRAEERAALNKVRLGDYEAQFPLFKKDANWIYF